MLLKQGKGPGLALRSCFLALALGLVGCAPYQWLRDDYMGKDILQPRKAESGVPRDEMGNPILEDMMEEDNRP